MKFLRIPAIPLLIVTVALSGCGVFKDKDAAEAALIDFHQKLNNGDFEAIYSGADADLRSSKSKADFLALLGAVHKKLGKIQSSSETNFSVNTDNFYTKVVLVCDAKYDGGDATETFTFHSSGGQVLLLDYNINSMAMMVK